MVPNSMGGIFRGARLRGAINAGHCVLMARQSALYESRVIQEQSGNKEFAETATNTAMIRNTHLIQRRLFLDVSLLRVDQRAPFLIER